MLNWDNMSLCERKSFISRECAQLACDFCEARDHQGITALYRSLELLVDFVDAMTFELEISARRDCINENFKAVLEAFNNEAIDVDLADKLAALADNVREYAQEHFTAEDCEQADKDAYRNIKSVIDAQAVAVTA